MKIIIHRVNTIEKLKTVPKEFGVEIDVRGYGNKLLLNHDPIKDNEEYTELEDFLKQYNNATLVFNLKEAGYESRIIDLTKKYNINDYFLLDVEFPYLYNATRNLSIKDIAVRYSEAEPIEAVEMQVENGEKLLDWVWIDTNTKLPLDQDIVKRLEGFKTCLVCPERWGRPEDIENYAQVIKSLNLKLDAVMTASKYADKWLEVMK